jgi:hypothetical protein
MARLENCRQLTQAMQSSNREESRGTIRSDWRSIQSYSRFTPMLAIQFK